MALGLAEKLQSFW